MDKSEDGDPKVEISEGVTDSTIGNSSDETDPSHFNVTTDLVGPPSNEENSKPFADDNLEGKSSIHESGSTSSLGNNNPTTEDMDKSEDGDPKVEVSEGVTDSTIGNSSDETDPSHSTVTTDLVGRPSNEENSKPIADNLEGKSSIHESGSTSSLGNDNRTTEDATEKLPSTTEPERGRKPSLSEEELDTSNQDRPALHLVRQEAVPDSDPDLTADAHSFIRSSQLQGEGGPHAAVEMDTFNRSSTRRDSFILAIENGEGNSRQQDNSAVSTGADSETTTDGATPAVITTKEQTTDHGDVEESFPDVEELDIFGEEESDRWRTMHQACQGRRKWVVCGTALAMLAVLTAIILIPNSLVYVEYYQMALARSRLTGRVDRGRTLYSGCYLFTPDTDLVLFKATAHHVHRRMEVLTSDGLAVDLQLSVQYFIKGDELGKLHKTYGEHYEDVMLAVIENEVKNSLVNLTLNQYRLERATVENYLYQQLASKLEGQGDCCPRHCLNGSRLRSTDLSCNISCNPNPNCTQSLHVSLLPQHVQLGAIDIPEEVSERLLRFTLLEVEAEKEALLQESTVENKITELKTKDIKNRAHEVLEAARWEGRRLMLEAEASAELRRQRAYSQALRNLLGGLNITAMDHRLAVLLLMAYREVEEPLFFEPLERISLFGGVGHA